MLKGATYHILFTDVSQLPPPFRIDNLSEVKYSLIKEALSVLMLCAPVFIFTSGGSALLERP